MISTAILETQVGRTIAGLDGSDTMQLRHIAEAINYRTPDRRLFG